MKSLKEIEESIDFSNIVYKGFTVWMLVRSLVCLKIVERDSSGYSMSFRTRDVVKLLKNGMTGIFNIFLIKKFDYWFFANTDKRNLIDGKYKDAYFDDIADKLGQDKSLFVEYTIDVFKPKNQVYSKYITSDLVFKLVALLMSKFVVLKKTKELSVIEKILKEEKLNLDLQSVLKKNIAEYRLYKFIFKYSKPKAIFVFCYYSKIPILVAAHDCGIKVVEYQHGVITDKNGEYNTCLKKEKRYFPDLLLSFGKNIVFSNYTDFIYEKENIIPLGSSYMEFVRTDFRDDYLEQLKEKYSRLVCVTSSGMFLDKLMLFVQYLSFKNLDTLFIVRKKHREEVDKYLTDRIVLLPQYSIYHILKYSDYNITIGSFVAYEADFYGVDNILLNINNISSDNINSDVQGVFIEENDMINFDFLDKKIGFKPSDNYFVRFNDRIDIVCSYLKDKF